MSDEVSQFLEQVERLRDQQVEEDEVRARELEEYLAAKRERQARREERARSISPQKSSPANTPSPRSAQRTIHHSDATKLESPTTTRAELRALSTEPEEIEAMATDLSPSKENHPPLEGESKYGTASAAQSRSSPLSWQRRPTSRGGSRPLSMVAAQNATQRSLVGSQEPPSATEDTVSRDQIARALGAKDPTWFRQTADRGVSSAAYRRNQVEDDDRSDMSSPRAQLPGMSQEKVRQGSTDSTNTSTHGRLASPARLDPPQLSPQHGDNTQDLQSMGASIPTSPGRTSPTRSTSPTKGMGGFVQSAMMKRSDGVKRWSVVSPTGLTRADSLARPSHERNSSQVGLTPQKTGPGRFPDTNNSRPISRHGDDEQQSYFGASEGQPAEQTTPLAAAAAAADDDDALPVSPSKTMDQRRWSPTKSSWLESALSKKETPKAQSGQASPSQPAWRMELKNQASKSGASTPDTAASSAYSHRHQVSIGGLMRHSPMGTTSKTNMTGLGGIYSPPTGGTRPLYGHGSSSSISRSLAKSESPDSAPVEEIAQAGLTSEPEKLEPEKRMLGQAAGTAKVKPATPPKKDFRSNLKQRSSEPTASKTTEPEFKNVFGTLRKTKTQNYVAPDELKSNIMKGKAALAVTGGPQKTERKDEFKEAILKKKEDFKKAQIEGHGVKPTSSSNTEKPIPEGLARRATLGKASAPKPGQFAKPVSEKPVPGPKRIVSNSTSAPVASSPAAAAPSAQAAPEAEPEKAAKAPGGPRALPNPPRDTSSGSPRPLGKVGGGKLADRFNPALASMLARGPPGMSPGGGNTAEEITIQAKSTAPDSSSEPSAPGPQLTHMTKGRARGPKRKAPSSVAAPVTAGKSSTNTQSREQPTKDPLALESVSQVRAEPLRTPTETSAISEQVAAKAAVQSLPIRTTDSPTDARPAPLRRLPSSPGKAVADPPSPLKPHKTGDASSQPGSPRKLDMKRMSRFLDDSASGKPSEPAREPIKLTHQRTGSRSPTKFSRPAQAAEATEAAAASIVATPSKPLDLAEPKPAMKSPPIKPKPSFDKLARAEGSPKPQAPASSRPLPIPPPDSALVPSPLNSPMRSPSKQGNDVGALLDGFFGPDRPIIELKVDPAEILMNHPVSADKVQTTGFQVVQVSSDGKKAPVASHNERVLFDQEMYICYHEFMASNGRQLAEVFFWVGDEVPEPIADDASLFAQKEARSIGGKLVKIRQGKETAQFLQAIGGVAIVRRGTSSKFDSLAPSMLCGRRCLGQVAFDEVDFATTSLCSGFPYLVTHSGKCYLWKGKGSDVDELGCARLVGIELSMTGELIELDEGSEPDDFWAIFDGAAKPHSADHWRLKPNYNKYCCRLFCSDAESRQQIFEISPFAQSDLSPLSIYIVDAFFEMYIVVGSRAQSQYSSFRNALTFAQDYAIMAAGLEDRPFVPVSTVVLEGIPRDLKRVFRNWSDARSPTAMPNGSVSTGPGLKRVRSLRVVPLTQALRAVNE